MAGVGAEIRTGYISDVSLEHCHYSILLRLLFTASLLFLLPVQSKIVSMLGDSLDIANFTGASFSRNVENYGVGVFVKRSLRKALQPRHLGKILKPAAACLLPSREYVELSRNSFYVVSCFGWHKDNLGVALISWVRWVLQWSEIIDLKLCTFK
jgi:hypothetical protein